MISKIIFLNVYHQSRLQVYWEHSIPLELDRVPYWRYRVTKLPLLRLRKLICQRCQCVLEIWIGKIQCKHRNLILLNSTIAKHSLKATKMVWCINHFSLVILSSANSFGKLFLLLLFSKKKKTWERESLILLNMQYLYTYQKHHNPVLWLYLKNKLVF